MSRVVAYEVKLRLNYNGELLCAECFIGWQGGGGGWAGQAFTSWTCEHCGKEDTHHNTSHPRICFSCAFARLECQRCMQPTEMITKTEIRTP